MPKRLRKRRLSLYEEHNGKCFWCNCQTIFPVAGSDNQPSGDYMATVEHLRSKFHPERTDPNHQNETRLVLACLKCNSLRSWMEDRMVRGLQVNIHIDSISSKQPKIRKRKFVDW